MSPRSPQVTTKAAAASTYAFTTHWRLACVEWKSWAIAGRAVLIDVVFTQTANSGTHTAARVHQARESGRDAAIAASLSGQAAPSWAPRRRRFDRPHA